MVSTQQRVLLLATLFVGAGGGCSGLPRAPSPTSAREMIVGQPAIPVVDLIIVHGCPARSDGEPSTCNRRRVRGALKAYREGRAPFVMFTGGPVLNRFSEARVMADHARALGLPESSILIEEESRHTVTNLSVAKGIMKRRGMKTALLVSESMHLVWAKQLADFYRMRTWLYPADMVPPYTDAYQASESWDEYEPWKTQTGAYGKPLAGGDATLAVNDAPRTACILVGNAATLKQLTAPLQRQTGMELQTFEWTSRSSQKHGNELSLWIRAWTQGFNGPLGELVVVLGPEARGVADEVRLLVGDTGSTLRIVYAEDQANVADPARATARAF